jgi:hypothetical protein
MSAEADKLDRPTTRGEQLEPPHGVQGRTVPGHGDYAWPDDDNGDTAKVVPDCTRGFGELARFQNTSFINFLPGAGLLVSPVSARGCSLTSRGDLDGQLACGPSYDFRLPSSKLDDDRARYYRGRDRLCVEVKPIIVRNPKHGPASCQGVGVQGRTVPGHGTRHGPMMITGIL